MGNVQVKIDERDKLSPREKSAKWIGKSSRSDGHCIYWSDSHKISVERNIIFNDMKYTKYAPILSTENESKDASKDYFSKHLQITKPAIRPVPIQRWASSDTSNESEIEKQI
jgi:hypothetical protein